MIEFFVNRSKATLTVLLMLLLGGAYTYAVMPRESFPQIQIPILYISLSQEGVSPEDAEILLVRPIESELESVKGIREITASAYQGGGNILLEFDAGYDLETAKQDVQEAVDSVKGDLPDDAREPTVNEVSLNDEFPLVVVNLYGQTTERALYTTADRVKDALEMVPGVLDVRVRGKRNEHVEVRVDPERLETHAIGVNTVAQIFAGYNTEVATGALESGNSSSNVKVASLFRNIGDVLDLPLVVNDDNVVTVADVAVVRRTFKPRTSLARLNGTPGVSLEVLKDSGANSPQVFAGVKAVMTQAEQLFPPGIRFSYSSDSTKEVDVMVNGLQNSVVTSVLLVMVIILGVLGIRSGILVSVSIPGSLMASMIVLDAMDISLTTPVLFSLMLSIGLLVDASVVVTEHAQRGIREGVPAPIAFKRASRRMGMPILMSTLTTLAAFLPLLFWPDIVGKVLAFVPRTLIVVLTTSLAMALIFIPTLGASLASVSRLVIFALTLLVVSVGASVGATMLGATDLIPRLAAVVALVPASYLGLRLSRWLTKPLRRENDTAGSSGEDLVAHYPEQIPDLDQRRGLTYAFARLVRWIVASFWRSLAVVCLGVICLVGAVGLYQKSGIGVEFFPTVDTNQMNVNVFARGNLSVRGIDELARDVESRLLAFQEETGEIAYITSSIGALGNRGNNRRDLVAIHKIELVDWQERRNGFVIAEDIGALLTGVVGIEVEVDVNTSGPPRGRPVQLELTSTDAEALTAATEMIRKEFDARPELRQVNDTRPIPKLEWSVEIDKNRAGRYGLAPPVLGPTLRLITNGAKLSTYRPDDLDDEVDVVALLPPQYRTFDQMNQIRVTTPFGPVPMGYLITRNGKNATGIIQRVNGKRVQTISADVAPGKQVDEVLAALEAFMPTLNLPDSVGWSLRGDNEDTNKSEAFLQKAMLIAVALIAAILILQFNSFYSVLVILMAVVMSSVGVLLGQVIMNQPFGIILSGIGLVSLAGIVVNNNIVLLDTIQNLERRLGSGSQAIAVGVSMRLRPILLTAVTTMVGVLPAVFEVSIDFFTPEVTMNSPSARFWVQLSTAIFFGLLFATLLTLLFTPALLGLREHFLAFVRRIDKPTAAPAAQPQPQPGTGS